MRTERVRRVRIAAGLAILGGLVACGGPGQEPPGGPEPEPGPTVLGVEVAQSEPSPPPEPEPSLEDRWRAPFAVQSSGDIAPRPPRPMPSIARRGAEGRAEDRAGETPAGAASGSGTPAPGDGPGDRTDGTEEPVAIPAAPASPTDGTPAARGDRTGDAVAAAGVRTHRVEWGETWLGLARRYGVRSSGLAALNPGVDPERLRAGEVLRVPDPAAPDPRRTHTVVSGDSLWGISRRYGVTIERLREVNRLADDRVRLGQVLIIP